ncbi:hypothetical protein BJV77DRAFT_1015447, partial [Russula vinacea]
MSPSQKETYDSYPPSGSSNRTSINSVLHDISARESIQSQEGSISNFSVHSTTASTLYKELIGNLGQGGKPTSSSRNQCLSVCTTCGAESNRSSTATSAPSLLSLEDVAETTESSLPLTPDPSQAIASTLITDPSSSPTHVYAVPPLPSPGDGDSQTLAAMEISTADTPFTRLANFISHPTSLPTDHIATLEPTPPGAEVHAATRARALRSFEPTESDELAFEKGDIIRIVNQEYKDWWGQLGGRTGKFTASYVEPLPDPTPGELVAEAQQEAAVFSQTAHVDRLLTMLSTLDPAKDNLVDNEEIQELYRSYMSVRPKIVKLIEEYSQKRAHLEWMDERFVRARKSFDGEIENEIGTLEREVPIMPETSFKWSQLNLQIKSGVINNSSGPQISSPPRPSRQESSDIFESLMVSLEDPAWKVLPAALRKYKINTDEWQNYAMFICYVNRIERCLSYDEKPLALFQKLKDASKNPVFMLKHIKDIRSPIAVAQQKQTVRKAFGDSSSSKPKPASQARTPSGQEIDNKDRKETTTGNIERRKWLRTSDSEVCCTHTASASPSSDHNQIDRPEKEVPVTAEISYAVAIYPYMAEQEDEFDLVVARVVVVQRDPAGTGIVDSDTRNRVGYPLGVSSRRHTRRRKAVAEASHVSGSNFESPSPTSPRKPHPSSSHCGEEMDLLKDDVLRVFKRYNHWSYVRTRGGDYGWVPSWYIGKKPSTSGTPASSNVAAPGINNSSVNLDKPSLAQ